MPRLTFDEVHFAYGQREVLAGVSFAVEPGERVAVVGPNGAGKSTLLRLASGYFTPSRGHVRCDDRDVGSLPRRQAGRQIAGVAADEAHAFPFTVREAVALGRHPWRGAFARPSAEDESHVERALAAADLGALAGRPLPTLSSGERQRVALARCLAQDARVLLLDEPTAHLDLGHQLRLLAVVADHVRAGERAVLAVLHDLNLAAGWADRVVLLVAGRVLADGAPGDVLDAARVAAAFGASVTVLAHPDRPVPLLVPRLPR
jgi:iron complex transport system ATP-binding protein